MEKTKEDESLALRRTFNGFDDGKRIT